MDAISLYCRLDIAKETSRDSILSSVKASLNDLMQHKSSRDRVQLEWNLMWVSPISKIWCSLWFNTMNFNARRMRTNTMMLDL